MLSTELLDRQLVDALPVSIFALDLDGHITSAHAAANRFSEDTNSRTPIGDEHRRIAIWDAMPQSVSREQTEYAMRSLRTGRAAVVRWELNRTADDPRVLLAQMTPLHDDGHAVTGFVVTTTDVTSFDRAREAGESASLALSRTIDLDHACQEAAHQLRQTLRADVVAIALCDDVTDTPRLVYEYGADGDRASLEQRFADAWRSVVHGVQHIATSHANSATELTARVEYRSDVVGAITVVVDEIQSPDALATARRFLSTIGSQLAATIERIRIVSHDALRQRSCATGEVATGVAGEMRNPIFGISSAAQLLRFRAREDPVIEKNVGRILREVERLNRMVGTLVELGRPIALKLSTKDPDAVWDDVLESERGRLEARAIAVRRTRPGTPAAIEIDGEHLSQAFRSVLSNAVEAAPEATDITLHSSTLPNGGWRCRLTNGGAPIPPEMLPRVFELFLSTKPGSSGVGLALAQRIIEEHRGSIGIESTSESGTTVSISLPSTPRIASLT